MYLEHYREDNAESNKVRLDDIQLDLYPESLRTRIVPRHIPTDFPIYRLKRSNVVLPLGLTD